MLPLLRQLVLRIRDPAGHVWLKGRPFLQNIQNIHIKQCCGSNIVVVGIIITVVVIVEDDSNDDGDDDDDDDAYLASRGP